MKFLVVFAALFAVALAAPASPENPDAAAVIVEQQADIDPEGNFHYNSKTSNGIEAQEQGQLKTNPAPKSADAPEKFITVTGKFSYIGADGQPYTVEYTADENGFQPRGAHLPVAPVA